ncbi:hypothetical protein CP533_4843 [Ophiocordyceps camponoti-saundersi (nom. inval.)]|nr:hypothetical protein CP533_4843 [Ophiocordyceps camponoti-saundersi (nom. inval.)]
MVQYRVEVSPNNRAICKDTVCKANKEKILKGEIRFGTWVEIQEHGSWAWKHWGCVSGAQMVAVQELCDKGDGSYDFDAIDGYDELNDHADLQEKIRRCVEQGHIDAQDFKGDLEKNRPGEKGIRLTAKQKASKEKKAADEEAAEPADEEVTDADATEEEPPKQAKKSSKPSRAKANADGEETLRKSSRRAKTAASKPAAVVDEEDDELAAEPDEKPTAPKAKSSKPKKKKQKRGSKMMLTQTNPDPENKGATGAFIPLEANPQLMTKLIHNLGVSPALQMYDVYSLTDSDLLQAVPRPALALLLVFPVSAAYESHRLAEDSLVEEYSGKGAGEPVMWFRQTIRNACGLMGLLHALLNGPAANFIDANSLLYKLWKAAEPLPPHDRSTLLEKASELGAAHQAAASEGDTPAPEAEDSVDLHYVCFVKGSDGGLWEMDGRRKGPIRRGDLEEEEDVLSAKALALGVLSFLERDGGDLRFSAIALAAATD